MRAEDDGESYGGVVDEHGRPVALTLLAHAPVEVFARFGAAEEVVVDVFIMFGWESSVEGDFERGVV